MELTPKIPSNLHPYTKEILEDLSHNEAAKEIILGDGVALNHYYEYWGTVDLDGWWRHGKEAAAVNAIKGVMEKIAARDGLGFREKEWRDVVSFELLKGLNKVYSVQMGVRSVSNAGRAATIAMGQCGD
jgi:hypothetical protein